VNWNRTRLTYPLHNWKVSVSVIVRWGTSHHSADSKINQKQNGLSTKANKATLKQARWNPRSLNLCQRATNNNLLQQKVKVGQEFIINSTNNKKAKMNKYIWTTNLQLPFIATWTWSKISKKQMPNY
jgi:hypothetical protein